MDASNIVYATADHTFVDFDEPDGARRFGVALNDATPYGRMAMASIDAGAPVADFVPPPIVFPDITDVQFFAALAHAGKITEDEAIAAVATGTIPAALAAGIAQLPAAQQFTARMKVMGQTMFIRSSPIVAGVGQALGWTSTQIDDLWRAAAAL